MSLIFKELTIRNFLSFGNIEQTIKLNGKNFQIITGKNLDKSNDDGDKNGCGKTTIFQALSYVLTGKSIGNKVNLGSLVNNINKKNMYVYLTFEKDGVEYRIERGRSPNFLHFYKNDEEITVDESLGDSRDTQAEITKVIGMSDDVFTQMILLSCSVPLFLDQTTSNQKQIIEKILGVDVISEKIDSLKVLIKDTKNNLNNELFKYNTIKENNDSITKSIEKQISDMNQSKQQRIAKISSDIASYKQMYETLSKIDYDRELQNFKLIEEYNKCLEVINSNIKLKEDLKKKIDDINYKISVYNKNIDAIKDFDFTKEKENHTYNNSLQVEIAKYNSEKSIYDMNRSQLNKELSNFDKLGKQISLKENDINNFKEDTCPTCGQKVNEDVTKSFKNKMVEELNSLKEEYHQSDIKIIELNGLVQSFVEKTFELRSTTYKSLDEMYLAEATLKNNYEMVAKLTQELSELQSQYDSIVIDTIGDKPICMFSSLNEIMNAKANIETIKTNIESLEKQLLENPFEQQEKSIEDMKKNLTELDSSIIDELTIQQEHQETLLKLLNSPSSFIRKTILDKSLEFLNSKISQYLIKLGSMHTVLFNNDMSITISSMGLDYSYVSSGEEGRINIALMLAFRDVWETLNNCSVNLMMIDELIDRLGLDVTGKNMFIESLKGLKNKNIMVVTHDIGLINNCDNIMTVVKEGGFSEVTYE